MARSLERQGWVPARWPAGTLRWWARLWTAWRPWLAVLGLLAVTWAGYRLYEATGVPVVVALDGQQITLRTHQRTVAGLLDEMGVHLQPPDTVSPEPSARLAPGVTVTVQRARPVRIEADGRTWEVRTRAETVRQLFLDAGIPISPYDEVFVDGQRVTDLDAPLPAAAPPDIVPRPRRLLAEQDPEPLVVVVRRAVPIWVHDGAAQYMIQTTAETIGEALRREGVILYLGDLVRPALGKPVTAGLHVYITRSIPFTVRVDGREIRTRTRQHTVADALTELGIVVAGADIVNPPLETALEPGMVVSITRVREAIEIEQEPVPYVTVWVPDDDLEIDRRRIDEPGQEGLIKRRFRVVYHDDQPVSRVLEDEWVAQKPITRVVAYGRKIVLRTLETPYGTITYWRKIRMLATSYSPSTAGVAPDDPYFGRTRLGWIMRKGIVAVDPTVVKLGSRVYVPGYGIGDAADTGGLIRGRRIDLGFDDHNLELWYRWVDVYLLAPPPPRHQIRWILPDWPRERRR